jgi:hypothetical protein
MLLSMAPGDRQIVTGESRGRGFKSRRPDDFSNGCWFRIGRFVFPVGIKMAFFIPTTVPAGAVWHLWSRPGAAQGSALSRWKVARSICVHRGIAPIERECITLGRGQLHNKRVGSHPRDRRVRPAVNSKSDLNVLAIPQADGEAQLRYH